MDADAMAELHSAMEKVGTTVTKTSSKVKG